MHNLINKYEASRTLNINNIDQLGYVFREFTTVIPKINDSNVALMLEPGNSHAPKLDVCVNDDELSIYVYHRDETLLWQASVLHILEKQGSYVPNVGVLPSPFGYDHYHAPKILDSVMLIGMLWAATRKRFYGDNHGHHDQGRSQ